MTKRPATVVDPDLAKVGQALKRSAARALERGLQTNTPVWVIRDGLLVDLVAERKSGTHSKGSKVKGSISQKRSSKRNAKPTKLKK
ncbi:MAG: hypothetical protein ACPGYT_14665 [Nitrospirales bacterium]